MKILFLDIDGVLNSIRSATAFAGYPYPDMDSEKFDEIAVSLIRTLCIKTNTSICLSSCWRHYIEPVELGKELNLPIISKTPMKLTSLRGEEIAMWLRDNPIEKYAIVDDDDFDILPEQLPYLIKVDNKNGLSFENYEDLLTLLK